MFAFAILVLATIAAFFIVQHLKSTTPLIKGMTRPLPFSDNGDGCRTNAAINFYVLHHSDSVTVWVVDSAGDIVQTVASGVEMQTPTPGHDRVRRTFYWYGRETDGQLAPDGTYHFQVGLSDQDRYVPLTQYPVVVDNAPPRLVVTGVTPSQLPAPGRVPATVHFTGSNGSAGYLLIYRTSVAGPPQLVDVRHIFHSKPHSDRGYTKKWAGLIDGRPAPAGTYVTALKVVSPACVTGTFPVYLPPRDGTTAHGGLTVSYLAAEAPLDSVPAGTDALVGVASDRHPYRWALRRVGAKRKLISRGSGTSTSLRVHLPGRSAGLYELAIRSAGHRTVAPLVARAPTSTDPILVILPALTWQGLNPVDDNGDGFPDTLASGGAIDLDRPADGLPPGFGGEAALLSYLDHTRMPYDLTTDIALADGSGPTLARHSGVVFAGPEEWLPAALAPELERYVEQGGRVLSLGAGSLQRTATLTDTAAGPQAKDPTPAAATDILGARPGALVSHNSEAIVVTGRDRLGLFRGTSGAFSGFGSFEPILAVAPPGRIASAAGTTAQTPTIVGYRLGSGIVVDIGLPTFTASLGRDVDTQELLRRLWSILSH